MKNKKAHSSGKVSLRKRWRRFLRKMKRTFRDMDQKKMILIVAVVIILILIVFMISIMLKKNKASSGYNAVEPVTAQKISAEEYRRDSLAAMAVLAESVKAEALNKWQGVSPAGLNVSQVLAEDEGRYGVTFVDIDGDNIQEMLIGRDLNGTSQILDLYAVASGGTYDHLYSALPGGYMALLDDGTLAARAVAREEKELSGEELEALKEALGGEIDPEVRYTDTVVSDKTVVYKLKNGELIETDNTSDKALTAIGWTFFDEA